MDDKPIGKGLFAVTHKTPNKLFLKMGVILWIMWVQLAELEREERYGDGTGPYCIGGRTVIQMMV